MGRFNEAFGLESSKYLRDIRVASCFRYIEFSHHRSTKIIHGPGLLKRIPDMDAYALEAKVDRPIQVQNRDFVVDLAGNLPRRLLIEQGTPVHANGPKDTTVKGNNRFLAEQMR